MNDMMSLSLSQISIDAAWVFVVCVAAVALNALQGVLVWLFNYRWLPLTMTAIVSMCLAVGLVLVGNDQSIDAIISRIRSLEWLSIGNPVLLKISFRWFSEALSTGLLIGVLPLMSLACWLILSTPVFSAAQKTELSRTHRLLGTLCGLALFLHVLITFSNDIWVMLTSWLLLTPLQVGMLAIELGSTSEGKLTGKHIIRLFLSQLVSDLAIVASVMILAGRLSHVDISQFLDPKALQELFEANPAALDLVSMGIFFSCLGRLALFPFCLGNDLSGQRPLERLVVHQLFFGLVPTTILLFKMSGMLAVAQGLTGSILMLAGMTGCAAAVFTIVRPEGHFHISSRLASLSSVIGSLIVLAIFSGLKTIFEPLLVFIVCWLSLIVSLLVIWTYSSPQKSSPVAHKFSLVLFFLLSLGNVQLIFQGLQFANQKSTVLTGLIWICIMGFYFGLGQCFPIQEPSKSDRNAPDGSRQISIIRSGRLWGLLLIVWTLTLVVTTTLTLGYWQLSPHGLHVVSNLLSTSRIRQILIFPDISEWATRQQVLIVMICFVAGIVWESMSFRQTHRPLALIQMARRRFYLEDLYFFLSLGLRGVAQLTRLLDWLVAGFLTSRVPQKVVSLVNLELYRLTGLSLAWKMTLSLFALAWLLAMIVSPR